MEYKVVEIDEGVVGDRIDGEKLEEALNDQAQGGWLYRSLTPATIRGGRGTDGLLIIFERGMPGKHSG